MDYVMVAICFGHELWGRAQGRIVILSSFCFRSEDCCRVAQNIFNFTGCLLTVDIRSLGFVEMRMFGLFMS